MALNDDGQYLNQLIEGVNYWKNKVSGSDYLQLHPVLVIEQKTCLIDLMSLSKHGELSRYH